MVNYSFSHFIESDRFANMWQIKEHSSGKNKTVNGSKVEKINQVFELCRKYTFSIKLRKNSLNGEKR